MTFKGRSRSLEMLCMVRRSAYDFLLPFDSNYGPVLCRFLHKDRCWSEIAKFIYSTCI